MQYSELHAHIEGTVSVKTLLKLILKYKESARDLPDYFRPYQRETIYELLKLIDNQTDNMELESFLASRLNLIAPTNTLLEFLKRIPSKYLKYFVRRQEDLELVITETLAQYGDDFERVELIFIPKSLENEWLTEEQIVEGFSKTWLKLQDKERVGFVLSLRRTGTDVSPEYASKIVSDYSKYYDQGIQKLDICADEAAVAYTVISESLKILTGAKQQLTLHIGEVSKRDILYILNEFPSIKQFNHGIQGAFDSEILDGLKRNDVLLTICPLSNIYTGVLTEEQVFEAISIFKEHGIRYSINSDDATIINGDVYAPYKFMLEKYPSLLN